PKAGLREKLAAHIGTFALPWTATDDPAAAGASGEVLWNNELQQGVMVFRGLAPNDPSEAQYQLWIFDATRSEAHPVDGGVFDVAASSGEVEIPIRARLPVAEPTLFAITVERPGGVVVSSRERLPLLAKVGG
ncbi:MAG: anti-sigma factor domain-containing protein, partial [Miltoncostaeaceae bacterium]